MICLFIWEVLLDHISNMKYIWHWPSILSPMVVCENNGSLNKDILKSLPNIMSSIYSVDMFIIIITW